MVIADAAAVDPAREQLDKAERPRRHPAPFRGRAWMCRASMRQERLSAGLLICACMTFDPPCHIGWVSFVTDMMERSREWD